MELEIFRRLQMKRQDGEPVKKHKGRPEKADLPVLQISHARQSSDGSSSSQGSGPAAQSSTSQGSPRTSQASSEGSPTQSTRLPFSKAPHIGSYMYFVFIAIILYSFYSCF